MQLHPHYSQLRQPELWSSPFEPTNPLCTDEQARIAVRTMVPHIYGISCVYAGFGATRTGNTWRVPLVYAPGEQGDLHTFHRAPAVGWVEVSAHTAELLRLSERDEVLQNVQAIMSQQVHAPVAAGELTATPLLQPPVKHHEVAWRYTMLWLRMSKYPTSVVAGTPTRCDGAESWDVPVFIPSPDGGQKQWSAMVQVHAASGLVHCDPQIMHQLLAVVHPLPTHGVREAVQHVMQGS